MAMKKKAAKAKSKSTPKRPVARAKKAASGSGEEAAMMAAWQKAMTPADGHRRLEPMVGTFKTRMTFVMGAGAPADVTDGVSENRWVLGGRYLEQRYRGTSMGMPFEGLGYTGYDNVRGKYVGTWMDTFGTSFMLSNGVGKPTAKEMEFESLAGDPSGKPMRFQCKLKVRDRNRHSFEMWTKDKKGKLFRTMCCEYVRA